MSYFSPKPDDEILPSGVIVRTCENGSKMYIGIGAESAKITDKEYEVFLSEIMAEEWPELSPRDKELSEKYKWWD